MQVMFTLVGSDDGNIYKIDTIEHEGALWLVPEWVAVIDPVGQEPARAIRLTGLDYERSPNPDADHFLKTPIPKSILHERGQPKEGDGFVVVDRPIDNRVARPN